MNTGQTMLSIGALILLSAMILRVNSTFLSTDTTVQAAKYGVLATSIATSYIEEASRKQFDQNTSVAISDSTLLSTTLGLDGSETYSSCNDFDDFNNMDTLITNLPSATFNVHCKVSYINPQNPDVDVNYPTWNKKLTVTITSEFSPDTIRISSIFSYFKF
jgi:MSHA pilin protein MshD